MIDQSAESPIPDLGRILRATWDVITTNVTAFGLVAFLLCGAPFALQNYFQFSRFESDPTGQMVPFIAGSAAVTALAAIAQAYISAVAVRHLDGQGISTVEALGASIRNLLPLMTMWVVIFIGTAAGFLLLIVPGMIVTAAWSLAWPIRMVEGTGVFRTLERSAALTRDNRLAVTLVLLVTYLAIFGVLGVLAIMTGENIFGSAALSSPTALLGSAVGSTFSLVLRSCLAAALYVELRNLHEGDTKLAQVFA